MEAKGTLAAIRSNANVKGPAAQAFREAGVELAKRNPTLAEAKYFLELDEEKS